MNPHNCIVANLYYQPTGGPILLFDEDPDEPKSLLELKKKTAPPAPAPTAAANGASLPVDSDLANVAAPLGGAAAAAGVLTAVDEDEEGGEEAPVPDAFEVDDEEEMEE